MDVDILKTVAEHGKDIEFIKGELKNQRNDLSVIQNIALNVQELAINMKNMLAAQTEFNERLNAIEKAPIETARYYHKTMFSAIISAMISCIITALVTTTIM